MWVALALTGDLLFDALKNGKSDDGSTKRLVASTWKSLPLLKLGILLEIVPNTVWAIFIFLPAPLEY